MDETSLTFSVNLNRFRRNELGSSVTFTLLLMYIITVPLRFEIPWLHVYLQLAIFLVIILRVLGGLNRIKLTKTQVVIFIILAMTLFATIFGHPFAASGENLKWIPVVTRFLVIPLACVLELDSTERINQSLMAIMCAAALVSTLSIINLYIELPFAFTGQVRSLVPGTLDIPRSLGIAMGFGNFGVFAIIGATYATMSLFRPATIHGSNRNLYTRSLSAVVLTLILTGVYLSQSRSTVLAFLIVAAWGIVIATFHPDPYLRSGRPIIPGTVLLCFAAAVCIGSIAFFDSIVGVNSASVSARGEQYRFAVDLMHDRPMFGGGWRYSVMEIDTEIHNLWLRIGHALGVPMFLLWIYLFGKLGLQMLRQVTGAGLQIQSYNVLGIGMLLGASIELTLYPGFFPVTAVLMGILLSIIGLSRGLSI